MKRRLRDGAKLIIVDPRRIDLVRSAHVEAQHFLQLRPGTNVAIVNALGHVIVTDDLVDHRFVAERCDPANFAAWAHFVALPENSPEATELHTGVPAADLRAAAHMYATGGNAAIYYGLGVTEHSQGSTMVMGMANLAMATGNLGRDGVGVQPALGRTTFRARATWARSTRALRVSPVGGGRAVDFETMWSHRPVQPGLRIPNMFDAAIDGHFKGCSCRAKTSPERSQHRARDCVALVGAAHRADIFINETAKLARLLRAPRPRRTAFTTPNGVSARSAR